MESPRQETKAEVPWPSQTPIYVALPKEHRDDVRECARRNRRVFLAIVGGLTALARGTIVALLRVAIFVLVNLP